MAYVKIADGVYSVGVLDWDIRSFHGHTYTTRRGTTYNAYLILDEKNCLVDTVAEKFSKELLANIRQLIPLEKLDYIIANHVEADHSGALPELMRYCPKAKVVGTQKCQEGLYKHYYGDWGFQVVKTGDAIKLGKKTLQFIEAPMIHWPDSMFTYCPQESLLMPNDAFGQHYATSTRFDDEVDQCELMDEAVKYYANILWPLSSIILRKLQEIEKLNIPIKIIAPSHGIVWRSDPGKIINAYMRWASNTVKPKVVIVYETMWGSTAAMAAKILEGINAAGVEVKLFDVATVDHTDIVEEMLDAKGFLFGSSTHDNDMLPHIAGLLELIKGFKPKERFASAFGSYGWAGGALKEIEEALKSAGIPLIQPSLGVKYVPNEEELKASYLFGNDFANRIKGGG